MNYEDEGYGDCEVGEDRYLEEQLLWLELAPLMAKSDIC